MPNQKLVCLYHRNCLDGTAAAAVVLRKFPNAELIPIGNDYTEESMVELRPLLTGTDLLIIVDGTWGVDWCVTNFPDLPITIIDHHESSQPSVSQLASRTPRIKYIFDQQHCAAVLTWQYLFPNETVPKLLLHVEDGDLWLERDVTTTRHVTSVLSLYRNQPATVLQFFDTDISDLISQGQTISSYVDVCIEQYVKVPPVKLDFGDHTVLAFNITDLQSACGNYLATKHQAAVVLFTIKGEVVRLSFRSTDEHTPSALDLAATIGGGGHRNSSGGQLTRREFIDRLRD